MIPKPKIASFITIAMFFLITQYTGACIYLQLLPKFKKPNAKKKSDCLRDLFHHSPFFPRWRFAVRAAGQKKEEEKERENPFF